MQMQRKLWKQLKSNHYDVDKLKNEIERFYPEEPITVNEKEIVAEFPISMPMFNIGFKDSDVGMKGKELLRKEVITEILLDMILKEVVKFLKNCI